MKDGECICPIHVVAGISFPSCLLSKQKQRGGENTWKFSQGIWCSQHLEDSKDMIQQNNTSMSAALQHSLKKREEGDITFMCLNAVILIARKLCYWVWLTYPTHSDQILLYIAETYIRWLLVVRNVFWTAESNLQIWQFLSNFCQEFLSETQSSAKNSKNFFSGTKVCGPFPHSHQHTHKDIILSVFFSHERRAETVYSCESLNILLISKHILSKCLFVLQYCTHLQPLLIFFTSK